MQLTAQILSEAEVEKVHQTSLRILAEVGVRYFGNRALPILASHGAKVDLDTNIAYLPYELVEGCLAMIPKTLILAARNPLFDYTLPSQESRFCIDGTAAFVSDFYSGKRRYGTGKDIEQALRVFQQLDLGVMAWAPTCASDAPAGSRALHEFFSMIRGSSKHGQHELHTTTQVPFLVEGLQAVMESEAAIKERKCFSLIYCPVAPLSHDGEMLDAYLELGQFELPVMVMPMPIIGTTGPASLFSNICLANAETLSSIVIYQLANPGRPIIYSSATGVMDFMSGAYLGGVPEMGLMSAALIVMADFYGLPSSSAGVTADAKQPGSEAILEKIMTTITPLMLGSDIIVGFGELEGDQLLVLEQLVVDNEIAHLCQRIVQGIDASDSKVLFDDIHQVGPGGNFLKTKSTRLAPRTGEFYISHLIPRGTYEAWIEAGKPTIYDRARERVVEILEGPLVDPLPDKVEGQLQEILNRADAALGNGSQ